MFNFILPFTTSFIKRFCSFWKVLWVF